ncbi:universal stress protein [Halococcus salifodinae]|uniref:Universal stress protein uspa-like protein n=1 Tax=Halococcus salifodinae DSM 8989 TaxID=1227456 RepID=M0NC39_9EURY|nr:MULTISPECIES: universal stress protein [Halococcus]EMA55507.1 universal stress protein uspa-like protein [Halococcus salifodinae DSM 8989]
MTDVYEHILVPTDGSDPAAAALGHALGLATQNDAILHALFVIDTDKSWLTVSRTEVDDAIRDIGQETSEQVLGEVEAAAADAGAELVTEVLEGTPDERILTSAADDDADLIVMGTHGHSGLQRRLLGSVTERVIRGADVPVMAVSVADEDTA